MVRSKVCTTSRTKERRIRLSPNTAIQFYDVQDRLGYDRATKAIDWLMKEAKVAIDALGDANQDLHPVYRVPATTTVSNPSEALHRTSYEQNQQNMNHDQTSNLDNPLFGLTNPNNRCPQEMNVFSDTKAPLDFTWEPIQSSFACPIAHTGNNGSLGCCFQQEIQVREDEKDNLAVVAGHYFPADTSVLYYQD